MARKVASLEVVFHRSFKKQYEKLTQKVQRQFEARLGLFMEDQSHPLLHSHALVGELIPLWSINVSSDYRALYVIDRNVVTFHKIGTHGELYK